MQSAAKAVVVEINIPFLAIHGTLDEVTLPIGSHYLMEKSATEASNKELKLFEGLKHEMCHENPLKRNEVIQFCVEYFENRLHFSK